MTTMPFPARDYLPVLRELTGGFTGVLRTADPAAPVADCGAWTLADLGTHLGNVHRWAASVVTTGESQRQSFTNGPGTDLASWYASSAQQLLDALEAADPEDRCWHFGGAEKTKAFWYRRQVHETAVHLADARHAAGQDFALDPAVAADGVDEVLAVLMPRVTRWHPVPQLPGPVALRATDTGDVWTVHPGEPPALGPAADGAATVEAPARDLLLRLWKRTGPAPRTDGAAAAALLAAPLTP
ncbi:maleylpyruvate isomerase family mycothiol-dependent enzyme [Amycolatopsis sp., V23-08]|uniref:Maleylpyruvate isomerase family mycothiol-dependent enzyme n=1 Tax=Amycolatopsis heterodermiae TaxID=3110235 RepID=A0ABU5RKD1_9PSEU|nr:maleylpyruvate isomerase family mycothiol-dependent enzyme [Amycolatopsis sp., V23-08]MEA5366648.1 maleylpyruvate isomerase family mycothiol-dependent enzyme [Amycolatopsis sp., V23-08]